MSRRVVMLVLPHVGGELRVHNPTERQQPEREPSDDTLSNAMMHRLLSRRRCRYRLLFLNPRDGGMDCLFGEQAAFDVFLHAHLLIKKHADR